MPLHFHRLPDSRLQDGFSLLKRIGDWLESNGRRQRISQTTLETYEQWQAEQANFFVTQTNDVQAEIVGIVTLRYEVLEQWPRFVDLGPVPMIRGLATDPDHRGKGVGTFAMKHVLETCPPNAWVFLDCVSDFLPDYYAELGFQNVDQQVLEFPGDGHYNVTLMRMRILNSANLNLANPI